MWVRVSRVKESDEGLRGLDPKNVDLRGVIDSRSRASGESL